jgi:hypothetical protein
VLGWGTDAFTQNDRRSASKPELCSLVLFPCRVCLHSVLKSSRFLSSHLQQVSALRSLGASYSVAAPPQGPIVAQLSPSLFNYGEALFLICMAYVLSAFVPELETVFGLTGAISGSLLVYVLPAGVPRPTACPIWCAMACAQPLVGRMDWACSVLPATSPPLWPRARLLGHDLLVVRMRIDRDRHVHRYCVDGLHCLLHGDGPRHDIDAHKRAGKLNTGGDMIGFV